MNLPTSRRPEVTRIDALTAIRGIAAWWVVTYHFKGYLPISATDMAGKVISYGYLAVDLFFILSGFVITLNYLRNFESLSYQKIKRFLLARLARIYPLHLFMCIVFVINPLAILIFSTSGIVGPRYDAGAFFLSLTLMHNWGFLNSLVWNVPSWSISTEWFAYLLFPIVAVSCFGQIQKARVALLRAIAMMAFVALLFISLGSNSLGSDISTLGLVRCLTLFAIGALICRLYILIGAPDQKLSALLIGFGATLFICLVVTDIPDFLIVPCAFTLLIYGLCNNSSPVAQILRYRPILFLGEISYSTYMVHYFVYDWVKFLLIQENQPVSIMAPIAYFGVTLVASVLLYQFIEKPCRRLGRSRITAYSQKRN